MSFYQVCFYFLVYGFLGWCCEVVFAALATGKFVNRGFLNGPVCPVYGFGMLLVILALTPFSGHLLALFIGSFVLTSAIEYVTGYILEKVFHEKWWDYSEEHFNLKGYICLKFSILWGFACTFVMECVHPLIAGAVARLPRIIGIIVLIAAAVLIALDTVMTVMTILKLRRQTALIKTITGELKRISDAIGEGLYDGAMMGSRSAEKLKSISERGADRIREFGEEKADRLRALSAEAEKLRDKLAQLKAENIMGYRRLSGAFPNLKLHYDELIERTKQIKNKIKR